MDADRKLLIETLAENASIKELVFNKLGAMNIAKTFKEEILQRQEYEVARAEHLDALSKLNEVVYQGAK